MFFFSVFFLMIRRPPRSTRTDTLFSLHDALPIWWVISEYQNSSPTSAPIRTPGTKRPLARSEEHTSELQSLMRISYAVFCLKKKKNKRKHNRRLYHYKKHTNTTIKPIYHHDNINSMNDKQSITSKNQHLRN